MPAGEGVRRQAEKECEEKVRLMDEYAAATAEFSRTVNVINRKMGLLPRFDYYCIRNFIEAARRRSDAARLALEEHVREHDAEVVIDSKDFALSQSYTRMAFPSNC